jgi:hypothetical protein
MYQPHCATLTPATKDPPEKLRLKPNQAPGMQTTYRTIATPKAPATRNRFGFPRQVVAIAARLL